MMRFSSTTKRRARQVIKRLSLAFCLWLLTVNTLAAQPARLTGNVIYLPVVIVADQAFEVELTIVADTDPAEVLVTRAAELTNPDTTLASVFDGVNLSIPSIEVAGALYWGEFSLLSRNPPVFVLVDAGLHSSNLPPQNCTRPEPDISNGPDDPQLFQGFLVPPNEIFDGGPGPDGIPAIESPLFTQAFSETPIQPDDLVVGVYVGGVAKAYPHSILDYHEIVNDRLLINGDKQAVTLSYCPLTGSSLLWKSIMGSSNSSFGVSGLLYNSNLVLYDRETQSFWAQMLEQAISGPEIKRVPEKLQVVETTWQTWLGMYPDTFLLRIEESEFNFRYDIFPYGLYRTDTAIFFPTNYNDDTRLHPKERVLGINVGESSKVYPISRFGQVISVINDRVGNMDVVATGSSGDNFAVVFNRQLEDCTVLDFSPVENRLPIAMIDNEGTEWDVFGTALAGPRAGTQLQKTNSYIAYWFAWAAFFAGAQIHE